MEDSKPDPERSARIKEAERRRKSFVSAMQLLAFDGSESEKWQKFIWDLLTVNLGRCDICIREYYIAKLAFMEDLRTDYEDEDVKKFFAIIDRQDVQRIQTGLKAATASLQKLPEAKRGIGHLGQHQLYAIFEALICDAFLDDPSLIKDHFEEPFRMVQTRKPLVVREFLPAVTRFLFSTNQNYSGWAKRSWEGLGRAPSDREWSWAVKETIQRHLERPGSPESIIALWRALGVIAVRLDADQITHKLYDIQPHLCMKMLDNFSKPGSGFPYLLNTLKILLRKAPQAFWQAMGSISSSTIAEQIFGNPLFDQNLQASTDGSERDASSMPELSWITPFVDSLKPAGRPHACRTIVEQLSERIRSRPVSIEVKGACYEALIKVLKQTIVSFSDNDATRQSVKRLVLSDTLKIVSKHMDIVLNLQSPQVSAVRRASVRTEALDVVRNALALECQCLKADFGNLSKLEDSASTPEVSSYTPEIWNTVLENLHNGDVKLASAAVLGVMALPGLEMFRPYKQEQLSTAKLAYNTNFERLTGMLSAILERLNDFDPSDLDELYKGQNTSMSLISALFSADGRTYQAAVDLIKNISGQSGRQEALSHLLNAYMGVTVYSFCWTIRRIYNMATFASVPRMLKSGMEVLDVLCNTQTGVLRTQKLIDRDFGAVQRHWSYQWAALNTIFEHTERWSGEVHDKEIMTDMCRDAMQYADTLFDQYQVLASALVQAKPGRFSEIPGILLDGTDAEAPPGSSKLGSPARCIGSIAKWLRLRDQYLADTSVKLLTKMFYRLARENAHIDLEAVRYVQSVATTNKIKTNLSGTQKGDLARAVEAFTKEPSLPVKLVKQSKLQSWMAGAKSDRTETSASTPVALSEDEFGDSDFADSDLVEVSARRIPEFGLTATIHEKKRPQVGQYSIKPKAIRPEQVKRDRDAKAFIDQRRRETEARKARDRDAAARLRGVLGIGEQTKGQGSGVQGIGIKGKDHASGIDSMMVSSESDSDSDTSADELDKQLFGNRARPSKAASISTVKLPSGPVKKIKQQRTQKDIRARLAPDLSSLHKTILGWDFFAETELPPNSDKEDYSLVTNTFKTPAEYQRTFEPLLILESWQSFRTAREDGNFKPFGLKVSTQMTTDNFIELNTTMTIADGRALGIGPSDVVLLSTAQKPAQSPDQPHCLARVKQINYKKGDMEIVYCVNAAGNTLRPRLKEGTTIWGANVLSLTPLEREYGALMALPYYDLCEEIVRAKPSPLLDYPNSQTSPIMGAYKVNRAQAMAVISALDNDGFTLIQGPPGSGKSSTICAMVGAMMSSYLKISNRPVGVSGSRVSQAALPPAGKKILVCAPSNAAVDELVMRFKAGVRLTNGATEQISVVRLGRSDAINSGVKDVTLEELVNARLSAAAPREQTEDIHKVMMEHKETSNKVNELMNQISETRGRGEVVKPVDEREIESLRRKRTMLSGKIDSLRESQNTASRDAALSRKRMQQTILDSAHILCATLSGSGHDIFQSLNVEFDTVIIDEAAQSIELSALIPLKYGCSKCILVGDPKQLPPTVLSREAAKFQYEQSLFARMEKNHQKDVHLLDTQYRMHPEISLFPSKTFYDSRLKDGPDMAKLRARPWHHSKILGPYRFFDVQGMSSAASKGHSLINTAEANVAMQLYDRLVTDVSKVNFAGTIGIITPYKGQLRELKTKFVGRYGEDILKSIEFNTTDAFQGRECDIIIFSCVRANTKGIGFLNDIRRMNVGLTRAKCSLWVLGNSQALSQGEFWRALLQDARSRDLYTDGDIQSLLKRPLLTADMMNADIEMIDVDDASSVSKTPHLSERQGPGATTLPDRPSSSGSGSTDSSSSLEVLASKTIPKLAPAQMRALSSITSESKGETSRSNSLPQGSTTGSTKSEFKPKGVQGNPSSTMGHLSGISANNGVGDNRFGPSGGRYGLNEKAVCNICGSANHFAHACDNAEARAASLGLCRRCQKPGHTYGNCTEPRCLDCGAMGHSSSTCTVLPSQRLSAESKAEVEQQELEYNRSRDRAREKRAEKQLAQQETTIPKIKTTNSFAIGPMNGKADAKRKREDQALLDAPRGPKAARVLVATAQQSNANAQSEQGTASNAAPGPPAQRPGQGPPRPLVSAPLMKKKRPREDDLFMKKR
jgi:senataxin